MWTVKGWEIPESYLVTLTVVQCTLLGKFMITIKGARHNYDTYTECLQSLIPFDFIILSKRPDTWLSL